MKPKVSGKGFSLIELMTVITLLAIFLMMGAPSFSIYLENQKIANVAEAITTGMQKARANAVRRNVPTEFVLLADGWTIQELTTAMPPTRVSPAVETFNWGATGHNWAGVSATATPVGQTIATFDAVGRLLPKNLIDDSLPPQSIAVTNTARNNVRRLQVDVMMTGGVRSCDQDLPVTDPKACNFSAIL